ncbi:MAG TPA: heat-inducible transcription repressor HrcA [Desulfurobacteriaceae bacterium]|nr:heat-inducible transcription repressor HrcA [Desulfurobacteriaceae bacterium]
MELSEREKKILFLICEEYLKNKEPIGSRYLWKKYKLPYSPSTIRNIMSDLEDKNLVYQPYFSAGRVPTNEGLKLYLEHLLLDISSNDTLYFDEKKYLKEDIFKEISKTLSERTKLLSFSLDLSYKDAKIDFIQLIPLSKKQYLCLIFLNNGQSIHKTFSLPYNLEKSTLLYIQSYLNKFLKNLSIKDAYLKLLKLKNEENLLLETFREIIKILASSCENFYFYGLHNLIENINNLEEVKNIVKVLEEKEKILSISKALLESLKSNLSIILGADVDKEIFSEFSFVVSKVKQRGNDIGLIGIIGPKFMEYKKAVRYVEKASNIISSYFSE